MRVGAVAALGVLDADLVEQVERARACVRRATCRAGAAGTSATWSPMRIVGFRAVSESWKIIAITAGQVLAAAAPAPAR